MTDVECFDSVFYNVDLHDGLWEGITKYFASQKDKIGLHATTSCFAIWHKNARTNGFAKVIPAPLKGDEYFVFFFDDNIDFAGCLPTSDGITNLRALNTGEFVVFAEGNNGFGKPLRVGRHTEITSSSDYNIVLVKVNIMDAMQDVNYFTNIVRQYAPPTCKIVAYVDINSTVVFGDLMTGKDKRAVVLSTIYDTIFLSSTNEFAISWPDCPTLTVSPGTVCLNKLVKKVMMEAQEAYKSFWTLDNCVTFIKQLQENGAVMSGGSPMDEARFREIYNWFLAAVNKLVSKDGIVESWYALYDMLQENHLLMLNTFGVDSNYVVHRTLERFKKDHQASMTVVNYERWSTMDTQPFEQQFSDGFHFMLDSPTSLGRANSGQPCASSSSQTDAKFPRQ